MQNNPYQTPRIAADAATRRGFSLVTITAVFILGCAVSASIGFVAGEMYGWRRGADATYAKQLRELGVD